MKALTYALALITLAAVTPGMAAVFTWTGNYLGDDWDQGDNWYSASCMGRGCYPKTTDDDAQITEDARVLLVDEEIDSLTIQSEEVVFDGNSVTLTVNLIIIAGGEFEDTNVEISGATIQTD